MTDESVLTRRTFLGAVAAIPATVALTSCGPGADPLTDAGIARDAGVPGDAGSPLDGGAPLDAPPPVLEDAGVDAATEPACGPANLDLVRDFGAAGDGVTNDSEAFRMAAARIARDGGGTLTIPPGTYIVGEQLRNPSGPFYDAQPIFSVADVAGCITISGYGAIVKTAPGLRFGAFDPDDGEPLPGQTSGGNTDAAAHVGRTFELIRCADVRIEGVEIDGSNESLILGGGWGDRERQTYATGIWMDKCLRGTIVDVHSHHHGLDGIAILHLFERPAGPKPHRLERVVSEYNGRQGVSWIGGWGLECVDCQFNHTGRAVNRVGATDEPVYSAPGAGVDIEPNPGRPEMSRDGVFTRCELIDNAGPGLHADVGDGGYSTFTDCVFWGTTYYSVWAERPGLRFSRCTMHGTVIHAHDGRPTEDGAPDPSLATLYEECTFEDLEWTDGRVFRRPTLQYLYDAGGGATGATWRDCTFRTHRGRAVYAGGAGTREIFERCEFVFGDTMLGSGATVANFGGSRVTSCLFRGTPELNAGTRNYVIGLDDMVVGTPAAGDDPTHVEAPRLRWGSASGRNGDIPPGPY